MNEGAETKICRVCAEPIKAAAKLCPYCHAAQGKWVLPSQETGGIVLSVLLVGALIWLGMTLDEKVEGRSFASHRKDLQARQVELKIDTKKRPGHSEIEAAITGTNATERLNTIVAAQYPRDVQLSCLISNSGSYPWRVLEMEVQMIDQSGEVVDVYHPEVHDPFVIQPEREHAFVVQFKTAPTNEVAGAKVRISQARDGDLPPKDN